MFLIFPIRTSCMYVVFFAHTLRTWRHDIGPFFIKTWQISLMSIMSQGSFEPHTVTHIPGTLHVLLFATLPGHTSDYAPFPYKCHRYYLIAMWLLFAAQSQRSTREAHFCLVLKRHHRLILYNSITTCSIPCDRHGLDGLIDKSVNMSSSHCN